MLAASEQIEADQLDNFIIVGELALTGAVESSKVSLPTRLELSAVKFFSSIELIKLLADREWLVTRAKAVDCSD
jgi:predicted ATPase with chaperone activity